MKGFMNNQTLALRACVLAACALSIASSFAAHAQKREHLTHEEIEQVRENQVLDARIGVFIKAVERRLRLISGEQSADKRAKKDEEEGGALEGTRSQLLSDVDAILDESIVNIEDAAIHSEKSPLIPKALLKLSEACTRFLPQLIALRQAAQSEGERVALERSIESAEQVIDSAGKLTPEERSGKKGEKKEEKKDEKRKKN